jgi:hypothetical protein
MGEAAGGNLPLGNVGTESVDQQENAAAGRSLGRGHREKLTGPVRREW